MSPEVLNTIAWFLISVLAGVTIWILLRPDVE